MDMDRRMMVWFVTMVIDQSHDVVNDHLSMDVDHDVYLMVDDNTVCHKTVLDKIVV